MLSESQDMNSVNKLKGIPHVYYFNMDSQTIRRNYMESQFNHYGINYTRVSGDRFSASNYKEWIDIFKDTDYILKHNPIRVLANFASHIMFLYDWYHTTNDDMMLLMEDDYDLSLIDYWHFDWEYLMSRLPYDWDTLQLGYEHYEKITFFLNIKDYKSLCFGPTLINRSHVNKILNLFLFDGKIVTHEHACNYTNPIAFMSVDSIINNVGKNYTLPLITTNVDLFNHDEHNSYVDYNRQKTNRYIYHYWWATQRDRFTLDDFFTMYKLNDSQMTEYLNDHASRALMFK